MEKLNWEFMMKVLPLYREALWLTLRLGLCGTALATAVGLLCAAIQYEKVPVLRQIVAGYIELSRNTPLLIQLFFIYYGLPKIGIKTDPAVCGVVGLAFLGGSYMAEAFRSGLEAIEPIQQESALSLGLTRGQTMRYVILPQAMSISMPAFMANVIFLLKETSVFSAVSLMDLMFTAKDLIAMYAKTTEALALLVVCYLLILLPVSLLRPALPLGRTVSEEKPRNCWNVIPVKSSAAWNIQKAQQKLMGSRAREKTIVKTNSFIR